MVRSSRFALPRFECTRWVSRSALHKAAKTQVPVSKTFTLAGRRSGSQNTLSLPPGRLTASIKSRPIAWQMPLHIPGIEDKKCPQSSLIGGNASGSIERRAMPAASRMFWFS